MLLKTLSFLLLLICLIQHGSCDCSTAELSTLSNCYNTYFHMLNTNADGYFEAADEYFSTTTGVDTLCNYFGALQKCLSDNVVSHCINYDGFQRTFGSKYGYDFTGDFYELKFTCGSGNKALKNQINCLNNLKPDCHFDYDNCSDGKDFINCYANAAKKSCGQDGYYFAYNDLSIQLCYSQLQCDTCTLTSGTEMIYFSFVTFFACLILFFAF